MIFKLWSEVIARSLGCAGVTRKDMIQVCYGYGLFTGGLGVHYGAEQLGATVIPISGGNTRRQVMVMQDFGSTVLASTPSYALYMAEVAQEMGVADQLKLRVGIFGAEPWSEGMRHELERKLGLQALDIYGMCELIGPGVSNECEGQCGLHVFEDHFYPEIIDPETGEVLPPGSRGELVVTTLTKEAVPIIRYRTRDITSLHYDTLRLRAHDGAHGPGQRALGRYANHPRRQRLPLADRGSAHQYRRHRPALSVARAPRRLRWMSWSCGWK